LTSSVSNGIFVANVEVDSLGCLSFTIFSIQIVWLNPILQNYVVCRKMDETRDHHVKQNKPDSER
jgi:hypothetical protein